jgi:RNA polymerase sigma factor (sigma-70 family)
MLGANALMTASRDLDSDAFMDAIDPLIPDAFRLAYSMVRSRDEASDVVQDATLSAWRHRSSFRPGADIRPWFLAIVANQCRQLMRQQWWSVVRRATVYTAAIDVAEAQVDESQRLLEGLRQLSHSDRVILVLRYYLDMSVDDTAATLRISTAAAKVRTHRALRRLRPIIGTTEDVHNG